MSIKNLFLAGSLVLAASCQNHGDSREASIKSIVPSTNQTSNPHSSMNKQIATEFLNSPFLYHLPTSPPTVGTVPTIYYSNRAPKATVLGDYNSKPFHIIMAIK